MRSIDSFPTKLSYSKKSISKVLDKISTKEMRTFLTAFSGFRTRYYRSSEGKQSQNFLLGQISQIANSNKDLKIKIKEFPHPWGQNSILVRFEPTGKNASDEVVIVGAHQDSTNLLPFLSAPGSDDDGSGKEIGARIFASCAAADSLTSCRYDVYPRSLPSSRRIRIRANKPTSRISLEQR